MKLSLSDFLVVFIILFGFLACQSKSEKNLKLSDSIDAEAPIDSTLLHGFTIINQIKLFKSYSTHGEFAFMEEEITLYRNYKCESGDQTRKIECKALLADYEAVEHSTYGYQIDSLRLDSVIINLRVDTILENAVQEIYENVKKHLKSSWYPNCNCTTVNFSYDYQKQLELQTVFFNQDWKSFNELKKIIMETDSLNKLKNPKM